MRDKIASWFSVEEKGARRLEMNQILLSMVIKMYKIISIPIVGLKDVGYGMCSK